MRVHVKNDTIMARKTVITVDGKPITFRSLELLLDHNGFVEANLSLYPDSIDLEAIVTSLTVCCPHCQKDLHTSTGKERAEDGQ